MIKYIMLMHAPDYRGIPVKTIFHILCVTRKVLNGRGHNVCAGIGPGVQHLNSSLIASAQNILRMVWVKSKKSTFATGGCRPVAAVNTPRSQGPAGNFH